MIGIDISDRSIKVVQLSNDKQTRLLSHCWHEVPEGVIEHGVIQEAGALRKLLEETLKECRISVGVDDSVIASIPETQSFLRVIEVPVMSEEEVGEAVQWEVSQHIPFGLENVYIDWEPVVEGHKPVAGKQEVLVGAAQKKVVDPLLNVLMSMDLDVAALELESQAIVRALISPELAQKQGMLIVDLGGTATNVIIHDHGAMRFTASLQRGAQSIAEGFMSKERELLSRPTVESLSEELIEKIRNKAKSSEEELVMEIRSVVEFYNSIDEQHEVTEVLLTGGGSNFPGLDRVVLRFFDDVHVQRGNPWVNILPLGKRKKAPISLQESVYFSTALGLALRKVY